MPLSLKLDRMLHESLQGGMKSPLHTVLLGTLMACIAPGAAAGEGSPVHVEGAWSRATPPGATAGAGYMVIANTAGTADRLVEVRTPAAARAQIHRSVEKDGSVEMRHQDNGVAIPAEGEVRLTPGGYHLMLMQLASPLEAGGTFPVTLRFERAGTLTVPVSVKPLTYQPGE
jgi:copper(I)-binding protein